MTATNKSVQEKIDKVVCKFSESHLISEDFLLSNDRMSYNVDVSENQGVIRLLTLNHKVLRGLLLFGTVVGMGLTSATLPAQASIPGLCSNQKDHVRGYLSKTWEKVQASPRKKRNSSSTLQSK